MRTTAFLATLFCLLCLWNPAARGSGNWPVTLKDAHAPIDTPMLFNSAGNLCVCVTTGVHQKSFSSVLISQVNTTGKLLWSKTLSQPNKNLVAAFMKLDSMDNIYVVAYTDRKPKRMSSSRSPTALSSKARRLTSQTSKLALFWSTS